jgi:signal transduction histidine kinase
MIKILVIEDAQSLRKDIVEMLNYENYEAIGAENGIVGVERAREILPDLIICDIMMPGMDGWQVIKALQATRGTQEIPFIFLTARTGREDLQEGMSLGADNYLMKPFTAQELLRAVHTVLWKRGIIKKNSDERAETIRRNIISALPHELRTPLNSILGFSDLLILDAETITPPRIVEMATSINVSAWRLIRLVENFLLYAQTELIPHDPEQVAALKQTFTLYPKSIIDRAVYAKTPTARAGDLVPRVEEVEAVGIAEDHLRRMIEELIDNAFKFSESGQSVTVIGQTQGSYYHLLIRDQGRGMSLEQRASVGAYMQFDRLIYEQQGSGLGLIIAKRLADLYGGDLRIESDLGAGTSVRVLLPLRLDALKTLDTSQNLARTIS